MIALIIDTVVVSQVKKLKWYKLKEELIVTQWFTNVISPVITEIVSWI